MRVLGIDPGYSNCGWAVIEAPPKRRLVASGTIRTKPGAPIEARLREVEVALSGAMSLYQPEVIGVEGWEHQGRRSHGPQGAHLSRLIGRIEGMAQVLGARVVVMPTSEIKRCLGCFGKDDVAQQLQARGYRPWTEHEYDAIAAAVVGARKAELS